MLTKLIAIHLSILTLLGLGLTGLIAGITGFTWWLKSISHDVDIQYGLWQICVFIRIQGHEKSHCMTRTGILKFDGR